MFGSWLYILQHLAFNYNLTYPGGKVKFTVDKNILFKPCAHLMFT